MNNQNQHIIYQYLINLDQYAKKVRTPEKIRWVNHKDSENNITKRAVYEICINPNAAQRPIGRLSGSHLTNKWASMIPKKKCHRLVTSSCLRTLFNKKESNTQGKKNTNDPEPNEKEFTMKTSLLSGNPRSQSKYQMDPNRSLLYSVIQYMSSHIRHAKRLNHFASCIYVSFFSVLLDDLTRQPNIEGLSHIGIPITTRYQHFSSQHHGSKSKSYATIPPWIRNTTNRTFLNKAKRCIFHQFSTHHLQAMHNSSLQFKVAFTSEQFPD